jgi:hypothetical protein
MTGIKEVITEQFSEYSPSPQQCNSSTVEPVEREMVA